MHTQDVFEILGISGREDSYTDLVKNAFDNNQEFKRNFCKFFANDVSDDFILSVRNSRTYIKLTERKTEIPDMLLYSRQKSEIILIENKIFSFEGYKQTERYSSPDFIGIVKKNLNMPNAKFDKFFYVTLDGKKAKSSRFQSIKWSEMILKCTENVEFLDPRLTILMRDLVSRSKHYLDFKNPIAETTFIEYFKTCSKWVTHYRALECFFNDILDKLGSDYPFQIEFSSANNANGEQLLIVLYNTAWNGTDITLNPASDVTSIDETFRNIHIELNWTPLLNKISLFIHYETNPYKTQKEFNDLDSRKIEQFRKHREVFQREMYKHVPPDWQKIGRELTIIKTDLPINETITHQDIETWLLNEVKTAYDCITETLSAI